MTCVQFGFTLVLFLIFLSTGTSTSKDWNGLIGFIRVYGGCWGQQIVFEIFDRFQRISVFGTTLDVFFGKVLWTLTITNVVLYVIVNLKGNNCVELVGTFSIFLCQLTFELMPDFERVFCQIIYKSNH